MAIQEGWVRLRSIAPAVSGCSGEPEVCALRPRDRELQMCAEIEPRVQDEDIVKLSPVVWENYNKWHEQSMIISNSCQMWLVIVTFLGNMALLLKKKKKGEQEAGDLFRIKSLGYDMYDMGELDVGLLNVDFHA